MTSTPSHDPLQWFVIHTKPRQEDRAISNLSAWKVECFTPKLREVRFNFYSGKPEHLTKPLFPRYIFARFNAKALLARIRYTRGVHEVVGFGDQPTPITNDIIDLVRSRIGKDGYVRIGETLKPGDTVTITQGSLKDFRGVFEREMKDADRVMILLCTISYQAHLVLPKVMIKRLNS